MTTRLASIALYSLGATFLFFLPELTRGRMYFGVTLPAEARASALARRALYGYRTAILTLATAVVLLCLLLPAETLRKVEPFLFIPMALCAVAAFNWARWKLQPLAVAEEHYKRSVELSAEPDRKGWIALVGSVPIVLLAAIAVALHFSWEHIPQRVAVHFGVHGPDRWLDRSALVVFGPVLIGLEVCAWLLLLALVAWSGMRRSRGRSLVVGLFLWLQYLLGSMLALSSWSPIAPSLGQIWVPMLVLGPWIAVGIVALRQLQRRRDPVEPTPDQCWKAGFFYFNRNDPALFVEHQHGNNFSLNFGNRMSWGLLAGTVSLAGLVAIQIRWFFN